MKAGVATTAAAATTVADELHPPARTSIGTVVVGVVGTVVGGVTGAQAARRERGRVLAVEVAQTSTSTPT